MSGEFDGALTAKYLCEILILHKYWYAMMVLESLGFWGDARKDANDVFRWSIKTYPNLCTEVLR